MSGHRARRAAATIRPPSSRRSGLWPCYSATSQLVHQNAAVADSTHGAVEADETLCAGGGVAGGGVEHFDGVDRGPDAVAFNAQRERVPLARPLDGIGLRRLDSQ